MDAAIVYWGDLRMLEKVLAKRASSLDRKILHDLVVAGIQNSQGIPCLASCRIFGINHKILFTNALKNCVVQDSSPQLRGSCFQRSVYHVENYGLGAHIPGHSQQPL